MSYHFSQSLTPLAAVACLVVNLGLTGCSGGASNERGEPKILPSTGGSGSVGNGSGTGSTTGTGGTAGGNIPGGTGATPAIDFIVGVGGPAASGTGGPVALHPEIPETCDGIDNDQNGIVDDLDVGHDGICDCLKIATLGLPGEWGMGNVFATWLSSRSVSGAVDLNQQVLTPDLLRPFQVIVAQNVSTIGRSYSPAEVTALNDWIKAGGGFMTMIGYAEPDEIANVNSLLAPVGMSYGSQPILPKSGGATIPVTMWQTHPVTAGIMRVGVDNGYAVMGTGQTLASEGGFDVLKVQEVSKGRVLMWGDEWITYNSEWVDHKDYQVEAFWLNMIKWLTPAKECQVPIPIIIIK